MVSTTASLALSCLAFVVAPAVILFALSFATLHTVEYGLDFNAITMTLDSKTWDQAGLKFLGFGHTFIKFPRVIQTIEFTPSRRGLLHTRTADGLPLTLGLSFQFRYLPARLYQLYLDYQGEEELVYVNNARAVISNTACNFSAYTFFNDKQAGAPQIELPKYGWLLPARPHCPRAPHSHPPLPAPSQGIAAAMQKELNRKFGDSLGAYVEALQISNVELPDVFQEAIVTSISTKQNITRSQRYLENMQVSTDRVVRLGSRSLQLLSPPLGHFRAAGDGCRAGVDANRRDRQRDGKVAARGGRSFRDYHGADGERRDGCFPQPLAGAWHDPEPDPRLPVVGRA